MLYACPSTLFVLVISVSNRIRNKSHPFCHDNTLYNRTHMVDVLRILLLRKNTCGILIQKQDVEIVLI